MVYSIPADLKQILETKRLIFTVTTGRSGTAYLAKILELLPDVASFHEPEPRFSDVMRLTQRDVGVAYKFWIEKKLPQIANETASIYIETSHLFCKGFVEPLLELGFMPDLIILTRPHRQVAVSLYKLGRIPGRIGETPHWFLNPEDPDVLPLPEWKELHDYQLCFWYCLEIENRRRRYTSIFEKSNARVATVSLDQIKKAQGFNQLTRQLDLPKIGFVGWFKFFLHRNRRENVKHDAKKIIAADVPPEKVLGSLEKELLCKLSASGIAKKKDKVKNLSP